MSASPYHPGHSDLPLIRAVELTKRYDAVLALDGLSLELRPGIIGLVGSNGAGKSTFLRILLGLIEPTSGSAQVLGLDTRAEVFELRKFLGYLPEHDCLPPDASAVELVTHMGRLSGLPRVAARERAAETLRHVGLHEERYRLIGGYSTGMKQRVKLAQALVHDPRLLLLDEPTNGLDPAGRDDMLQLIQRTGHEFGIAILVTSHLLGEIERVCDQLVAIEEGRLRYAGPVAALTQRTRQLRLEVEDDPTPFRQRLQDRGLEVHQRGGSLFVEIGSDDDLDVVRDAAADLRVALTRLEPQRHQLGELFSSTPTRREVANANA